MTLVPIVTPALHPFAAATPRVTRQFIPPLFDVTMPFPLPNAVTERSTRRPLNEAVALFA